ncbi:MAG: HEPN domain-containing protein [Geobacteraceae bacterium]|nr:HEPN domain-containing protein [Geobacteraceae bacterium]
MSAIDDAQMLLTMAAKDIKAMNSLLDPDSADDEIFGFHAQQATEKALKAWIVLCGGTYGRTHSLCTCLPCLKISALI